MLKIINLILLSAVLSVSGNAVDDLTPGQWYEVPNSHMREVCPDRSLTDGKDCSNVIEAWSGGAFDTKRDRLIVWGGGHADSPDRSVYVFDLNTLQWSRLGGPNYGPIARHTYNYLQYVASIDRFCTFGGAAIYPSGNTSTNNVDCFDFDTEKWESKSAKPDSRNINSISAYDPVSGNAYFQGAKSSDNFLEYDTKADRWTTRTSNPFGGLIFKGTADVDPVRRKMVFIGNGSEVVVWDIVNPNNPPEKISTNGTGWSPDYGFPGVAYHPPSGKFAVWDKGQDIYSLDMGTNVWEKTTGTGANPGNPTQWGTYGRFRYSQKKDVFVVVNSVDKNVFVYKPDFGGSTVNTKSILAKSPVQLTANPNPCHGTAVISVKKNKTIENGKIRVYNIQGKMAKDLLPAHGGNKKLVWQTAPHAPGFYILKFESRDYTVTHRILVLK
jgi:hypothetical protein